METITSICECCENTFDWNLENSCWICGKITCPDCTDNANCIDCKELDDFEEYEEN